MISWATSHAAIFLTIVLTVYGQLIIKWRVSLAGPFPDALDEKALALLSLLLTPWVISGFVAAFAASICWMAAVSRFELSYAYPFMSLSFVLVYACSITLMGEAATWSKSVGMAFIVVGIVIVSKG